MADRLGLEFTSPEGEINIENELRLRKIETALASTTLPQGVGSVRSPAITGLSIVQGVREIIVKWSSANISQSEFDYYELQFDTNILFTNPTIIKTKEIFYSFAEGVANTTYYVRIRTALKNGTFGDWSSTLNTNTGLASTNDVALNAITTSTSAYSAGDIIVDNSDGEVTLQSVTFNSTGSPVFLNFGTLYVEDLSKNTIFDVILSRGVTLIYSVTLFIPSSWPGPAVTFISFTDNPPSGTVTYYFNVEVIDNGAPPYQMTFFDRSLFALETKR